MVGAGPNGLTAAATLGRAGWRVLVVEAAPTIGGGTRSGELTRPGFVHDICSAVHPMALISPAFSPLDLDAHGVKWVFPEVQLAHPLDGGRAALLLRSVERYGRAGWAPTRPPTGRCWSRSSNPPSGWSRR